ncbi:MAG: threonine--tRNA ligase [Spirochaetales bacterium]|nr:threonine--tRNA ligase [Spirochaetales bacterium]MCF7938121.1 threonine--tRNA ligase [Spirochaetales bacterium]
MASKKQSAESEALLPIRHSTAHVMAEAVLSLFPGAQIAIGPAIEDGFYYDFDLPQSIKPEDLEQVEEKMKEIINGKHDFIKSVVSKEEARKIFSDQPYKLELLEDLPEDEEVSIYRQNSFVDLCRGPHVENTRELNSGAFKLLSVAGAYWRGDENRTMLQRIYGTAWKTPKELKAYLSRLKEIEARDHRKLGKELDLFSLHEDAGSGLVYWHPKGSRIRLAIEDFWRWEHLAGGYEVLYTPHVGKSTLWETSGHLSFYNDNMYAPMDIDGQDYYVKPMNCPFHIKIYQSDIRSYRDLPLRWAELGTVYRYERSGVLHGLMRVRGFTQDDAHIFCTPDQIEDEILEVLRFSLRIWKTFGFEDIKAYLATRPPEKSVGDDEDWKTATDSLKRAIELEGLEFEMDEGGGAFYGPKIDLKVNDALGREWQMTTIQFDFNLPERFGMTFVDKDGNEKRPFMVHRALLGSLERFFGVLIEHYGGAFPVWLAPVQVQVIPVAPAFEDYARQVKQAFTAAGLRTDADLSSQRMNAKIRLAQQQKVPYMAIVGEKEAETGQVSFRMRSGAKKNGIPLDEAVSEIKNAAESRSSVDPGAESGAPAAEK